jgi:tetratricopeptide (TPR) repeat protein
MNRKQRRQQEKNNGKSLGAARAGKDIPLPQALEMMVSSYEKGNREEAYRIAGGVMKVMPDDIDVLHFAGTVALELGKFENALDHLEKAVAVKPDHAEAWNGLGHAYLALKKIEPGIAACQKAVSLLNDMPEAHYNLGNALSAAGRMEEALHSFAVALEHKPAFPEALNNMGNALQGLRRFDEAADAFRRAIKINSAFTIARFNLANALMAGGKPKQAIAAYRDSIEANPKHLPSYNNLATVYRQIGQLPESAEVYRQALKINDTVAELHNNLGVVLQDCGVAGEAAACFKRALELAPQNAEAAFNLHAAVFDDTDLAPATEALERALAVDPGHERAHFMLGAIEDHAGIAKDAETHFAALPRDRDGHHPAIDSWSYMKAARGPDTRWFAPASATLYYCLRQAFATGAVLEFGVRYGATLRLIAADAGQPVHGFDSFQGLPEDWYSERKGSYTTFGELPDMPDTVTLHAGWFEDTLPAYIAEFDDPVRFMHVDCDLYTSTATIFDHLAPRIRPGTVIVFDEYLINPSWRDDEFKAFREAVEKHGWEYEYIAFSLFAKQAGVRITKT